jgi:hypothetical protein
MGVRTPVIFQRLQDADVAHIHDELDQQYWWLLRSLPAVKYLSFDTYTFPTSWRTLNTGGPNQSYTHQYDCLDYEYKVLNEIEETAFEDDLVVVTNEYYEDQTQYSVDHLVSRYADRPETLLVVTNSKQFTPRGGQRPLYMEQFVEDLGSYDRLYRGYEQIYEATGWSLPLIDTKNLFLHDNANLYELIEGETLTDSIELFEALPEAPYLPLYHGLSAIFAREDEYGVTPLHTDDEKGLERWLRRRVEWDRETAREMAEHLNDAVQADGTTFDPSYAARSPAVENARRTAENIDQTESSIHMRYRTWLQRRKT